MYISNNISPTRTSNHERIICQIASGALTQLRAERRTADLGKLVFSLFNLLHGNGVTIELTTDKRKTTSSENIPKENGKSREHGLMGKQAECFRNIELSALSIELLLSVDLYR